MVKLIGNLPIKLVREGRALSASLVDVSALGVLNPDRLRILQALSTPQYAAQLSRQLKMHPQTIYYHLRLLSQQGLIHLASVEEKGGSFAKKYAASAEALALPLTEWKPYAEAKTNVPAFFGPLIREGVLDAAMVLGSPEPHGAYRARGSEFAAIELAAFLARFAFVDYPLYYMDTQSVPVRGGNLVLVGGPKVNMLVHEANALLPIRFTPSFEIHSTLSGKHYGDDVGVVQTLESPFAQGKRILMVAGGSHHSTRVAVLALMKQKDWWDQDNLAHVVQGFDENGDGIVDAVDVLE
ncbi:helix-turn-helix domain-containing protein [Candidatus Micrarchaeota archaeon]|nr:helix-turn-helix domain-containing protein [Candidatus Micrarchaeota archaeon]